MQNWDWESGVNWSILEGITALSPPPAPVLDSPQGPKESVSCARKSHYPDRLPHLLKASSSAPPTLSPGPPSPLPFISLTYPDHLLVRLRRLNSLWS